LVFVVGVDLIDVEGGDLSKAEIEKQSEVAEEIKLDFEVDLVSQMKRKRRCL